MKNTRNISKGCNNDSKGVVSKNLATAGCDKSRNARAPYLLDWSGLDVIYLADVLERDSANSRGQAAETTQ